MENRFEHERSTGGTADTAPPALVWPPPIGTDVAENAEAPKPLPLLKRIGNYVAGLVAGLTIPVAIATLCTIVFATAVWPSALMDPNVPQSEYLLVIVGFAGSIVVPSSIVAILGVRNKQKLRKYYRGLWLGFTASLILVLLWTIFISLTIYVSVTSSHGGFAHI